VAIFRSALRAGYIPAVSSRSSRDDSTGEEADMYRTCRRRARLSGFAVVLALVLFAAACGDGGGGDSAGGGGSGGGTTADVGEPVDGGKVVYGLEAESSNGLCLAEAQLAISGIQVARAIYDTLTIPNADGEYVPYLAKSVTPNATFDEWTIVLRDGVKFHDGSDLTAEVVKNNLDAYRGKYANRRPLLFIFVYDNIDTVETAGPLTVVVKTKKPWPAFPAFLFMNGRFGVMAQAQLDSPDHCADELIGTGPFELVDWKINDHLTVKKNSDYWQAGLPHLDEIEFRPISEAEQRVSALQSGEINLLHNANALANSELRDLAAAGDVSVNEAPEYAEVGYELLNANVPPFDNINARLAFAHAIDRDTLNEVRNKGILTNASGPFAPGSMGYLEDTGYPKYDVAKAKEYVAKYEAETGKKLSFIHKTTPAPESMAWATMLQQMVEAVGGSMKIQTTEQSQLISDAIGNNFQAAGWRLHPGGDPDLQYVWWHSGSPVNFGKFADPEIDRLLEEGRVEPDPAKREVIYQDLNKRFASQVYDLWDQWSLWNVATATDVHGVFGADLPDGSKPFPGLADGHALTGLWVEG